MTRNKHEHYTQKDVDQLVAEYVRLSIKRLRKDYPDPATMPPPHHSKTIGLLKGTFTIAADVPTELQHGLFAQPNAEFPCYVRFSNSSSINDSKSDLRGVAIKLMNKQDQQPVQDFILINKEAFPLGTPWIFLSFIYWLDVAPWLVPLVFALKFQLSALWQSRGAVIPTLANQSFYSTTPFALGGNPAPVSISEENNVMAVKYSLRPKRTEGAVLSRIQGENYLRDELEAHLNAKNRLEWGFYVQQRTNPNTMPLNDASMVWDSPYVLVATLSIPAQDFNTPQQLELGDTLSFSLNHHQPMHQPIGVMNRVRMQVNDQLWRYRRERQKAVA